VQRQLPGEMALSIGYMGSTGHDIGYGGFTNTGIEINQIDPTTLPKDANGRWDAAALRRSVPNPFFGIIPRSSNLGNPTIPRAQLLKPFPEYGTVSIYRNNVGTTFYQGLELSLRQHGVVARRVHHAQIQPECRRGGHRGREDEFTALDAVYHDFIESVGGCYR